MDVPAALTGAFVQRPTDANKYTVGTVSVVGGSERYSHAPVIAGLGARAAGAGLVQLVVPKFSRPAAGVHLPEATFTELSSDCALPRADVTVVGMGLGVSDETEALVSRIVAELTGRIVLDADALTILASWHKQADKRLPFKGLEVVLTPHEGEAARLLDCTREDVSVDRPKAAKEIAKLYGATVVLKGARTLVVSADGLRIYENATGNPFMALGGMGDLLAGVIGARWAYLKGDPFLAAASSVWLHGAASDALVASAGDPSVVNTAASLGSLRVRLDDSRRCSGEL